MPDASLVPRINRVKSVPALFDSRTNPSLGDLISDRDVQPCELPEPAMMSELDVMMPPKVPVPLAKMLRGRVADHDLALYAGAVAFVNRPVRREILPREPRRERHAHGVGRRLVLEPDAGAQGSRRQGDRSAARQGL